MECNCNEIIYFFNITESALQLQLPNLRRLGIKFTLFEYRIRSKMPLNCSYVNDFRAGSATLCYVILYLIISYIRAIKK